MPQMPTTAEEFRNYYTEAKVAALQAAFNRVVPAGNWKTAIDATIEVTREELATVIEAIAFYTGSAAYVASMVALGNERYQVRLKAAGYYAAIGA